MSSEELLMHLSSNSNQSDPSSLPSKLAKLEARMAGKGSSSAPPQTVHWQQSASSTKFPEPELSTSSDSDDDTGGEYLIQPNLQKRQRFQEDDQATVVLQHEGILVGRMKTMETADVEVVDDAHRRKQGRGRGRSGRGRSSRANDQARSHSYSTISLSNGHLEDLALKTPGSSQVSLPMGCECPSK